MPDQGLNPDPLHWEHGVLATGPPGKSLEFRFLTPTLCCFSRASPSFISLAGCELCTYAQSCLTLRPHGLYSPPVSSVRGIFPGKNTRVGCHFLLQGNLPDPRIEPESPALQADFHATLGSYCLEESYQYGIVIPLNGKSWFYFIFSFIFA